MFENMDSATLWLTITNAGLGIVTVVCIIAVGVTVAREVFAHARETVRIPHLQDDHAFMLSDLGITMADGGTSIDEKDRAKNTVRDDEQNIHRSEN